MGRIFLAFTFVAIHAHAADVNVKKWGVRVAPSTTSVYVIEGANVSTRVKARVSELLGQVSGLSVTEGQANHAPAGSLVISIGDTSVSKLLITEKELADQGPEGFVVKSKTENGVTTIATNGNAANGERTTMTSNRGVSFGAYEVLQQLGFHFYHPFNPQAPARLLIPASNVQVAEKPRWPLRGLHLHTMHPIELSHV